MRKLAWTAVLAVSVVTATASVADACSRGVSAKAASTLVPSTGINQRLLDDAIRVEVNYHRCRAGLAGVRDAGSSLKKQAMTHSKWMARTKKLSHTNTIAGASTLGERIRKSGIKYRAGSENIVMVHRYQIDNKRFKVVNRQQCTFATRGGKQIPAHSYATLARHAVNLWMGSPGHRKNILDKRVSLMSTAVAPEPNGKYCGRYWLTQNFIG